MKKKQIVTILVGLILFLLSLCLLFVQRRKTQEETAMRLPLSPADFVVSKRYALDLLGGLVNRGFSVRDAIWEVSLSRHKIELLHLTLFAGNQYWFAAASSSAQRLKLSLYNDAGDQIPLDLWKDDHTIPGARVAGGLLISKSGNYYVGLELLDEEGGRAVPASLAYAYQ